MSVLAALWTRLAHPDNYAQYNSHKDFLTDLENFYKRARDVMQVTMVSLNRVESELEELCAEYATPALILSEYPLEVILDMMQRNIHSFENGRKSMDSLGM